MFLFGKCREYYIFGVYKHKYLPVVVCIVLQYCLQTIMNSTQIVVENRQKLVDGQTTSGQMDKLLHVYDIKCIYRQIDANWYNTCTTQHNCIPSQINCKYAVNIFFFFSIQFSINNEILCTFNAFKQTQPIKLEKSAA